MAEKEYIERGETYSLAKKVCEAVDSKPRVLLPRIILDLIDNLPAADVRPVVRGRWIMNDESKTVCSLCGNVVAFVSHPDRRWDFGNFCPNCGADMRPTQMSGANREEN